ncbi:hypothetical protein NQ314_010824 [Rhamnusium bicolor]|uniref:Uncharacterized protein n=1 Tax=Rhamnusium bicolor TaxID=1586634 RepID=A0AAV8XNK7_9CUCU|nr:hypothetical protein NQ314_010824 [Rhamnusium bicolor]
MKMCLGILVFSIIYLTETESTSQNNTAILISKYAKVAHWGANENDSNVQEGRSSTGQSLWTHGSDVNIISGQNVKGDKSKVAYHYAVYKKPITKIDDRKNEKLPAVGEVIQDRFNPRPYFDYGKIPPKKSQPSATYGAPMQIPDTNSAQISSAMGFDSLSAAASTAQPVDLYTSPYTSYNPPELKPNNHAASYSYPPNQDFYAAPSPAVDMYDYKPKAPEQSPMTSYATLGPPINLHYGSENGDGGMAPEDHNHQVDAPPSDHIPKYQNNGPPDYPPKSEDDVYYPYDVNKGEQDMIVDHPPADYKPPPPPAMPVDLAPPPAVPMDLSSPDNHASHFPQYLYDNHHYDHHVYEEVPHTTTEATEHKRVSGGYYSYYYLGRKLWYVPLYFSIYFIIYVTILILKSVARHKIQYKHKWISPARDARQLSTDQIQTIDHLHVNVTNALDSARKIYPTFSM